VGILNLSDLTWRSVDRIVLLACVLLAVWYAALGYLEEPGQRIRGSDSIGYYVYLPSVFMDGDLDLADDFRALGEMDIVYPTPSGRAGNIFSVGPALLWTPWFALGHLVAHITGNPTDGFSSPYQFLVYCGNTLYVVIGLLLTVRLLKSFDLSPSAALVATLSVLFATQLTYYILPKSATSHGVSFATMAALLFMMRRDGITWRSGVFGGLAVLVRWQNVLLLPLLAAAAHVDRHGLRATKEQILSYWPFALTVVIIFVPQMTAWQLIYGQPFLVPQTEGYFDPTRVPVLQVLFSVRHGLVTWHPWWLFAGIGLACLVRDGIWRWAILGCVVSQTFVNAMVEDWWGNWAFGQRRFLNLLPALAIGFGYIYAKVSPDRKTIVIAALVVLGLWNQAFINQYQRALIPRNNPPSYSEFVDDKFSLRKVWRTQLAVNTAVQSFRKNDFDNYLHFSNEAHQLYPTYRNTAKVHSVAGAVEGKWGESLDDFEMWLEIEPKNRVALWGVADIRLKLGQIDQAEKIVHDLEIGDPEVLQALKSGKGTLLTKSFFKEYRKELDRIYTD
jgi:hypothetical protein